MSISEIKGSIDAADGIASGVHARSHGRGDAAELAGAIHALCAAMRDLTTEVERLQVK
jgi:hypothetical protein